MTTRNTWVRMLGLLCGFWLQREFRGGGAPPKVPTAPPSDPPVTETESEVVFAEDEARRRSMRRKGLLSSVKAGETGGYKPRAAGGRKSLLGAGGYKSNPFTQDNG